MNEKHVILLNQNQPSLSRTFISTIATNEQNPLKPIAPYTISVTFQQTKYVNSYNQHLENNNSINYLVELLPDLMLDQGNLA